MSESTDLAYERISSYGLQRAIRLKDGEHVLALQPFGWHLDGHHIPNAAEHFPRESVCAERGWEVLYEFGPYLAVVREQQAALAPIWPEPRCLCTHRWAEHYGTGSNLYPARGCQRAGCECLGFEEP